MNGNGKKRRKKGNGNGRKNGRKNAIKVPLMKSPRSPERGVKGQEYQFGMGAGAFGEAGLKEQIQVLGRKRAMKVRQEEADRFLKSQKSKRTNKVGQALSS